MKIGGVIVEYNPMHNGHIFHLKKTRELTGADVIIAVMSGCFAQRGIPSIIDKWSKTKIALQCGADIVLELPAIYSLSSAEFFAKGSISLLNSLGAVDSICFGSECGDINFLNKTAAILNEEPYEFKSLLKEELKNGTLFPKARSKALMEILKTSSDYSEEEIFQHLNSSNNILGIEYLKSIISLNSNIKPYTLKREGGSYNSSDLDKTFSSATSIRRIIKDKEDMGLITSHVPKATLDVISHLIKEGHKFPFEDDMYNFIRFKALSSREFTIKNLPDVSEGLDNKILKALELSPSYEDCIDMIKSKRYARTRISRILCQYFLGFEQYDTDNMRREDCQYARLLGFNENGASALKTLKSNSSIPIYSKLPKEPSDMLKLDLQCTKSYSLLNPSINPNGDYLTSPILLK